MENKTIYLLSLFTYEEFKIPHIYKVSNNVAYVDAIYDQEASLKDVLSRSKIDRLVIAVDEKTYVNFENKEFSLKEFNGNLDNPVSKLINRIKNFVFNKQESLNFNINTSLFKTQDSSQYLNEYIKDKQTQNKINTLADPYSVINAAYCLSNNKAKALNENQDIQICINLYGNQWQQVDLVSVKYSIEKMSSLADHINIYYDTNGILNNDYYFLNNMIQLIDKDQQHFTILGVLDICKNKDSFVSNITDSHHIADASVVLAFIKTYAKTSQLGALRKLRDYYKQKNIPFKVLDRYISALSFIESGVALCNIATLKFGIRVLKKVHDFIIDTKGNENVEIVYKIFRNMIDKKFGKLIHTDTLQVSNLIQWCIENEYFQQLLTIIEALVPENFVKSGVLYYAKSQDDANKILEKWNWYYWKEAGRTKYIFDDLSHYFIKNYGRNGINNAQPREKALDDLIHLYLNATKTPNERLGLFYTNLQDDELFLDLLLQYHRLGRLRNEVAHALPQEEKDNADLDNLGEDETYNKVKRETIYFSELFQKALSLVNGDNPYIITSKMFSDYVQAHKIERKANDYHKEIKQ